LRYDAATPNGEWSLPVNNSTPALKFNSISKSYGALPVLRDVSFEIAAGECFGLAGINGAGKTTLIKCLLDFCSADSGEIEIRGRPSSDPAARTPLAFLPERFVPPYFLRGEEFLRHVLDLYGNTYDPERARAAVAALDFDPAALARPVRSYSKGMTQKLGLAACLLAERDVYVLDEPMSGLDPKARALVKAGVASLRAAKRTLFFTSHVLSDIEELCDRMAILHGGRLCFLGTPTELAARYGGANLEQAFLHVIGDAAVA
jgi:ABC-2 type transport system ATP-binding protein